jgi:serine O-acetyltransferase
MVNIKKVIITFLNKEETSEFFWSIRNKASRKQRLLREIGKLRYKKYLRRFNAYIPLQVIIRSMPVFPHGIYGVFISQGAEIGENCVIFHQVTIGSNTLTNSKGKGAPIIGDNVYIGCGAKIIGNVRVGDNARIGANCVVTKDIANNCTVVSAKPRIIENSYLPDNTYVNYSDSK